MIVNEDLLDEFRGKRPCERCLQRRPCEPHHVFGRGHGGWSRLDVRVNLIALCRQCHQSYHDGHILRTTLLAVVAEREKTTVAEIEDTIYALRRNRNNATQHEDGEADGDTRS